MARVSHTALFLTLAGVSVTADRLAAQSPAGCQPGARGTQRYEYDPGTGLLPLPVQLAIIAIERCGTLGVEWLGFEATLSFSAGNSTASSSVSYSTMGAVDSIAAAFPNLPTPGPVAQPCPPIRGEKEILGIRGAVSLYSFHIGSGGPFRQFVEGTLTACDTVVVTSPIATTIEVPVHVSGGVTVAESFGAPAGTAAKARLRLQGTIGGQSVGPFELDEESLSVIPCQASINQSVAVPLAVGAGTTTLSFTITGDYSGEASAQGGGLFGSVAGSSTCVIDFPNSIRVGNFRGVGGAPLPPGIEIRSALNGMVYETTIDELVADVTEISLATGGVQNFTLSAGPSFANGVYWLLGSAAGTSPGVTVAPFTIPLNYDGWFGFTLESPNTSVLTDSLGLLDAAGNGSASLTLPPLPVLLAGTTLHHAFVVVTTQPGLTIHAVSNPVPFTFVP